MSRRNKYAKLFRKQRRQQNQRISTEQLRRYLECESFRFQPMRLEKGFGRVRWNWVVYADPPLDWQQIWENDIQVECPWYDYPGNPEGASFIVAVLRDYEGLEDLDLEGFPDQTHVNIRHLARNQTRTFEFDFQDPDSLLKLIMGFRQFVL